MRANSLSNERELFLFDRKQLEISSNPPVDPVPKIPTVVPFPDDLESETDMASWRMLFKKRKQWAEYVLSHAQDLTLTIRETDAATKVMQRSVSVAFSNLDTHTRGLGDSLTKLREWADGIMDERERVLTNWEPTVRMLLRIAVHDEFKKYGDQKGNRKVEVLSDFFDIKEVQTAAATADILGQRFEKDVHDLGITIEGICNRTLELKAAIQQNNARTLNTEEQLEGLLEEVDILVNKIRTDNEYARTLQGPKSASAASKRAYASTTDYLPGLTELAIDIGKLLVATYERKNAVSTACHELLLNVASIQSIASPVNPQINKLDEAFQEENSHFQLLSLVTQLPVTYGSLLIECVRRREWSEKFQSNNQKLAEDLAVVKEDEEKRRRKWQRSTGLMLPFELAESQVLRAELTTRGDATGGLPKITRQDVEAYITSLRAVGNLDDAVKELAQALQDIDKSSKRVNKRLKGFKMGSIHEAGMMGSSVLSGRNDDIKLLRAEKEQLGERIKGYESRIRKLEDLLHRGRTANGNPYSPNPQQGRPSTPGLPHPFPSTPTMQAPHSPEQTMKPGIPHRRSSSEQQNSIEAYKARVAALVAELAAEKERATELQKVASENTEAEKAMNAQILQADETKKDLVANLDATLQQHISERKALTAEIEELTRKLENAEEELDRVEEEKVRPLEHELEIVGGELSHHREALEKEAQKNRVLEDKLTVLEREKGEEIMQLRSDLEEQIQRVDEESQRAEEAEASLTTSEKSVTRMAEEIAKLEKQLKDAREALDAERARSSSNQTSLYSAMKLAHGHLSDENPPEDVNALMNDIEVMIANTVARNKELSAELKAEKASTVSLKGEKEFLQNRFDSRTLRAKDLTQRLYTHNARSIQLLESLGYRVIRGEDSMQIVKVSRSNSNNASAVLAKSTILPDDATQKASPTVADHPSAADDVNLLYWMESPDSDTESEKYSQYIKTIVAFDLDAFSETIINRVKKAEQDARQLMKQGRAYREKYYRARDEASEKIAFKSFKSGDLALFLPTRNQATRPWAAFNVGAPHFFLREQDSHKLASRDWLLARISKVEERVVDLSRSTASINLPQGVERSSITSSDAASVDDENPFELSDGLRWYLLDATEEKAGAPSTPGLSSSTVASANVDARGSLRSRKPIIGAKKKLSEITTEHSRRSSSGSQDQESVFLDATAPPRTPVEKIVATVRSRTASIRSMTPAPQEQR